MNTYKINSKLMVQVILLYAVSSVSSIANAKGVYCSASNIRCDNETFGRLINTFINFQELAANLNGTVRTTQNIPHRVGRASCYSNNSICQGAGLDGYNSRKTASGVCVEAQKFIAAIDVNNGDPFSGRMGLGSLEAVKSQSGGKLTLFVTADKGQMTKNHVDLDLTQGVVESASVASKKTAVDFYMLKEAPARRFGLDDFKKISECVDQFNNTFVLQDSSLKQLTSEQKTAINNGKYGGSSQLATEPYGKSNGVPNSTGYNKTAAVKNMSVQRNPASSLAVKKSTADAIMDDIIAHRNESMRKYQEYLAQQSSRSTDHRSRSNNR
jgi:hypothetical protein